jgi:hypothetical protein
LKECREAVRLHEGIEKISEVQNCLDDFKELIDRMIESSTNYRQQVAVLKKEKEEVEQQRDLVLKEGQTTQEQINMVSEAEQ